MSIILHKKYIKNNLSNLNSEIFNQEYIICSNNKNIYNHVNQYCLKNTSYSNILNKIIDFENKNKPIFNYDIIDKINYNQFEYQKLILKWMSYIENNINRKIKYHPFDINFFGGCILNNDYNKIWSVLSYLIKDQNKKNLIICDDYDIDNILNFFKYYNINCCLINKDTNIFESFNIVSFKIFKQKIINNINNFYWNSIFISDIHKLDLNNITLKSKFRWCSSTPLNLLNNQNFFKIINFLCNRDLDNQINFNILTYVIQVLFIYTENNITYNNNSNFNIFKKEITFDFNQFEKKFYKYLVNNNLDFDIIKNFTSYPPNNYIFKSLQFNSKLKICSKKCIICYDKKNNVKLGCNHEFCFDCIVNQLLIKPVCPLCRKNICPEKMIIKKDKINTSKDNFLKSFIQNNKKQKILIVTQFEDSEKNIIQFLNNKKINFISINKKFKKFINQNNLFLLNYYNMDHLKELKNINYLLFFEPLYFSDYLRDKIESEIIGKINNFKTNLKIITLGYKNSIDEKFLI